MSCLCLKRFLEEFDYKKMIDANYLPRHAGEIFFSWTPWWNVVSLAQRWPRDELMDFGGRRSRSLWPIKQRIHLFIHSSFIYLSVNLRHQIECVRKEFFFVFLLSRAHWKKGFCRDTHVWFPNPRDKTGSVYFLLDVAFWGFHGPLQGVLSQLAPPGTMEHHRIL